MSRLSPVVFALSVIAAVVATPTEAAQRAFVSSSGMDANTASGCGLAAPCRGFAAAQSVVNDGGEIVALDGAGYGAITVTKNVTITANPGFYAGIAVASGDGVTIATGGINVTLRGLNINGIGGSNGVVMTNGARLSIENCVISNFTNAGVTVATQATVRIIDSLIRDNGVYGIFLQNGATATISGTKLLGNANRNVLLIGDPTGTITTAAISDSVLSGSPGVGIHAYAQTAGATVRASVTRSTLSNNGTGASASGPAGTGVFTISNSMVTGNVNGLFQNGANATLESLGNNSVRQNDFNSQGTITTVSPM
jgi:hypothetical protein